MTTSTGARQTATAALVGESSGHELERQTVTMLWRGLTRARPFVRSQQRFRSVLPV
jgi:hypothetical protein